MSNENKRGLTFEQMIGLVAFTICAQGMLVNAFIDKKETK